MSTDYYFSFSALDDNGHLHGCNVLYELVKPWANTDAVVVADSYFASVPAAIRLKGIGLRFIGVEKQAVREFPMQYLGSLPMPGGKGSRKGLLTTDEETGTQLMAFMWVDRDRRYFISTCSSLEEGGRILRTRWSQVDKSPNAEPTRMEKELSQPKAAETYYTGCGKIDQHNRHRQDTLQLEKKLQTNDWSKRVNLTIFSMIVIDSFLLSKGCSAMNNLNFDIKLFLEKLAEELIDNDYDRISLRSRGKKRSREVEPLTKEIDTTLYLTNPTPTKLRKKNKKTGKLSCCKQSKCVFCIAAGRKNSWVTTVCRECQKRQPEVGNKAKQYWCCKAGTACFDEHIKTCHPDKMLPERN
jgi:Transposase IS4